MFIRSWNVEGGAAHIAAHAVTGGVIADLQGGKFGHGFFSAGLTKAANVNGMIPDGAGELSWDIARVATAAVIGGTISEITGGKFANGATTAAFAQAFNGNEALAKKAKSDATVNSCPTANALSCTAVDGHLNGVGYDLSGDKWSLYKCACEYDEFTLTPGEPFVGPGSGTNLYGVHDNVWGINYPTEFKVYLHGGTMAVNHIRNLFSVGFSSDEFINAWKNGVTDKSAIPKGE